MAEQLATENFEDEDADELEPEVEPEDSEPESGVIEDDVADDVSDNIGDPSVEINVENLIHELEADGLVNLLDKEKNARQRLEELMEKKRAIRELEDFDDYDV